MSKNTKIDIRCKLCGKKLFAIITQCEGSIEIKCTRCKAINIVPLTVTKDGGKIE